MPAVVLGTFLLGACSGGAPPGAMEHWLRNDLHLPSATIACVIDRLDHGPLASAHLRRVPASRLRRQGIEAIPEPQRQLFGDTLIGCTVSDPGRPAGGS